MKKKLLEKDGFYLALFVCICLVAIGGVWFTKNNVDELTSNDLFVNKTNENSKRDEDEVHLIEKEAEKDDSIPTSTGSKENLEKAKEKQIELIDYTCPKVLNIHQIVEYSSSLISLPFKWYFLC